MTANHYSRIILHKVLDGDFQTKMEGVQFSTTPREVVTIADMEKYYLDMEFKGRRAHD